MKHKLQKNLRILDGLIAYCHNLGGTDYHMEVSLGKEAAVFEIRCSVRKYSQEEARELSEMLNVPRQHEMEQNYWGLSTNDMDPCQGLELMGMMVDEADIAYTNGELYILLRRMED